MKGTYKCLIAFTPIILIVLIFFYIPVCNAFSSSLCDLNGNFIGFERYGILLSNPDFQSAFWFTLGIASISTVISIALAVIIALALRDTFIGKGIALFLNQVNISLPHMIVATMMIYLLAQKGFISAIMLNTGVIDSWNQFPLLVEFTSPYGVIISYVLKFTPFVCMSVLAVLQAIPKDHEDQSRVLGIGRFRTFLYVTLPSIWPAILSAGIISFTYAFGSYEVPAILLHKNVISTFIYNSYYDFYNPNGTLDGYAGSIILTLIIMSLSAILLYLSAKKSDTFE